jgi:hypothetical protein
MRGLLFGAMESVASARKVAYRRTSISPIIFFHRFSERQKVSAIIINNLEVLNIFSFEMHYALLGGYPHQMQERIIRAPVFIIQKHIVVVGMVAR